MDTATDMSEESDIDDPEWLVLPLSIAQADEMCAKLNELVKSGKLPKGSILYKHLHDVVEHILSPNSHMYDAEIIEFFNTVEYLGGQCTANFVRACEGTYVSWARKVRKI